ncbi:hypothetical protein [uncultured Tenacibaculum sp.]|uniref:hypothetical protein n=1 Tax=uncultured Tenacibaculum sp. TaxID=174713 RepID=UPI0026093BB8|nr:hypothetical protein [uncultured Tenacibaculum sp.]
MENIQLKKPTNYKRWAFKFLIYLVILNIAVAYVVINFAEGFHEFARFSQNMLIFSVIGTAILIAGIIFTILSIVKKEEKNYQYYISIIGYIFFTVSSIMLPLFN